MGLLGNILVTFVVGFWPMVLVVSVIGMGGPGASNNMSLMVQLMILNSYPIWIFAVLSYTGTAFWGLNSNYFLIGTTTAFLLFNAGIIYFCYNLIIGIKNEGYSVANGTVYYNAKAIPESDSTSFAHIFDQLAYDKHRFYSRGQPLDVPAAEPSSFRIVEDFYYRDADQVFYVPYSRIELVEGADPETFEVIYEITDDTTDHVKSDARDAHSRYYNGEKVAPR